MKRFSVEFSSDIILCYNRAPFILSKYYTAHVGRKYKFTPLSVDRDRYKWVPATMARRASRLRKEERPPFMEGSCEYTKQSRTADHGGPLDWGLWRC
jgi:hypothetical protein